MSALGRDSDEGVGELGDTFVQKVVDGEVEARQLRSVAGLVGAWKVS